MRVSRGQIPPKFAQFHYSGNKYNTLHMATGITDPALSVMDITKHSKPGKRLVLAMISGTTKVDAERNYLYPGEIMYPGKHGEEEARI